MGNTDSVISYTFIYENSPQIIKAFFYVHLKKKKKSFLPLACGRYDLNHYSELHGCSSCWKWSPADLIYNWKFEGESLVHPSEAAPDNSCVTYV